MNNRLDKEFENLVISEGFVTIEQLSICQRVVDAFEDKDPRKSLDIIMADRGYITHGQWAHLLKMLGITAILCPYCNKRFKEESADFGKIVICKYCKKKFEYEEMSELTAYKTTSLYDKTLRPLRQMQDSYLGKLLGEKYEIIEKVATGGWSTIYKAKRTLLNMDDIVAIKILHVNLSDNPKDIKRFYNEAAAIRELHHPNAIHLYDFDRDENGTIYMSMEFIRGRNLKEVLKETGPFDLTRMLHIIFQICDVISVAHKHPKRIIHRDITPQNIMLTRVGETDDFVKVLDFGIAKLWTHDDVSLTGSIVGTPLYMAPEQWKSECDERTDIYSLGVVMYEMLAGEPPFKGDQFTLMNKHVNEKPLPFRKLNKKLLIPKYIENIIFMCLEKNRDKRPQSVDELKLLLHKVKNPHIKLTSSQKSSVLVISTILTVPLIIYFFHLSKKYKSSTAISDTIPFHHVRKEIPISRNDTNNPGNAIPKNEPLYLPKIVDSHKDSSKQTISHDNKSISQNTSQEEPLENVNKPKHQPQVIKQGIDNKLSDDAVSHKDTATVSSNTPNSPSNVWENTHDKKQENTRNTFPALVKNNLKDTDAVCSDDKKIINTDKYKYNSKIVANIEKSDINKEISYTVTKFDPKNILKEEIKTWLQEYEQAWEKGDITKLKTLGHISSEKDEDKLRQHYLYVYNVKVSIYNEVIEIHSSDNDKITVSFDRTDEWIDERGEWHKENLPRTKKTLCKKNDVWKIIK